MSTAADCKASSYLFSLLLVTFPSTVPSFLCGSVTLVNKTITLFSPEPFFSLATPNYLCHTAPLQLLSKMLQCHLY